MIDNDPTRQGDALARLIEALTRQAEASARALERFEGRALPLLERIALAIEQLSVEQGGSGLPRGRARGIAEFRLAIKERRWDEAEAIARDLTENHPDDPDIAALATEEDQARQAAAADLQVRLDAARQANDSDSVLALRDDLARLLAADALKELDGGLVKWLMALIHRRLRGGTIRPDLAELAGRVADRFGATPEGASLKASLPTLRRSAGLCPRCGEAYAGLADACPKCLGAAFEEPPPLELPAPTPPLAEEDDDAGQISGPVDLNNDQLWQIP